jgi:hypothetical protein
LKTRGVAVASNFRILIRRNNDNLELRLFGDFDGTSACELLNALKEQGHRVSRISVNTNHLKEVNPFGVDTFQKNLYLLKDKPIRLMFTGENANRIEPERNRFF